MRFARISALLFACRLGAGIPSLSVSADESKPPPSRAAKSTRSFLNRRGP